MSVRSGPARRGGVRALATGVSATLVVAAAVVLGASGRADAAVTSPLTQEYAATGYSGVIELGADAGRPAELTVPAGATVAYARLLWSGRPGDPGCGTGAASTQVSEQDATVPPGVADDDGLALVVDARRAADPAASVDVTTQLADVPAGRIVRVTVPDGSLPDCGGAWSLTVVYRFASANPVYAPVERHVVVSAVTSRPGDGAVPLTGSSHPLSAGSTVGVAAFDADDLTGKAVELNGTALPGGLTGAAVVADPRTATNGTVAPRVADGATSPRHVLASTFRLADATTGSAQLTVTSHPVSSPAVVREIAVSTPVDTTSANGTSASATTPQSRSARARVASGPAAHDLTAPVPATTGTIKGTVTTQDGTPLVGVTVTAIGSSTGTTATTTIDDGSFTLTGLAPDTYSIVETQPAGYAELGATAAGGGTVVGPDEVDGVTVAAGDTVSGIGFTETAGSISGSVFVDADGDGQQDGELGTPSTTVTVSDGTTTHATSTNTDGSWTVADLPAGTYTITETQPPGYVSGTDTVGSSGGVPDGTDDGNGTSFSGVVLAAGATATGYLFAELPGSASVSGTVTTAGGAAVSGAVVTATGAGGTSVSTTTDAGGGWTLSLPPDTYTLTQTSTAYAAGSAVAGQVNGATTGVATGAEITGVTVGAGASGSGYGFVDVGATLSGSVFLDTNGDGTQGTGDTGLGAALVLTGGGATYSLSSDPLTGAFSVAGLPAGTYTLTESQPAGYASGADTPGSPADGTVIGDTISGIVVGAGASLTGFLFPEYVAATVTGTVQTSGGKPLVGIGVVATRSDGTTTSTTTDVNGAFSLSLAPGTYTLAEVQPAAYGDGTATAGTGFGGTPTGANTIGGVQVTSGGSGTGYTFTDTTAGLSGTVYADADGDGVQDPGEPGIPGVTITVTTPGSPAVVTTTDSGGAWTVGGLPAGTYTITETQPAGYGPGSAHAGTAGGTPSADGNSITGVVLTVADPVGDGYDFADTTGAISGLVFEDVDGDGVRGLGEPGIAGVTLTALSGSTPVGTAVSAADGSWTIGSLPAGTYTLTETQPAGFADGIDTAGTGGGTHVPPDTFTGVKVAAGVVESGYTFGERRGEITGVTFLDADGDGVYTPGTDKPEPGVTVSLLDATGAVVDKQVSDADGTYAFVGLAPGDYTVVETQGAGYGSDTPDRVQVTLAGGGAVVLFGDVGATIAGTVWVDTDRNGIRGPGEPGRGGVTLTLLQADGTVRATTRTAADGTYAFIGLPAGTYEVRLSPPPGRVLTTADRASTGQTGSVFDPTTWTTAPITLAVSAAGVADDDLTADAGLTTAYPDLTVRAAGPAGPVQTGTSVVATITVVNDGNVVEPGAVVDIAVPDGQAPTTVGGATFACTALPPDVAGTTLITCTTRTVIPAGVSAPPIVLTTVPTEPDAAPVRVAVRALSGPETVLGNNTTVIPITVFGRSLRASAVDAGGFGPGGIPLGGLPFTGLDARRLAAVALLSLAGGLVLLLAGRRSDPGPRRQRAGPREGTGPGPRGGIRPWLPRSGSARPPSSRCPRGPSRSPA